MFAPEGGFFALKISPLSCGFGFAFLVLEGAGDDGRGDDRADPVLAFQNRKKIKQIARELGVARDTVRKMLRSQAAEFPYNRATQPAPKLGPWVETLTAILETEAKVSKCEQRFTQQLFEGLRGRGYDGAHDSVYRFVRAACRIGQSSDEEAPARLRG
jgi:hypothetical protein